MATNPGTLQLTEEEFPLESSAHSTPKQGRESTLGQCPAQSSLANDSLSQLSSSSHITRSPARNPMNFRTMQVRVTLLDGSLFTCTVEKQARGLVLFEMVCEHLNLLEKDYFALWFRDVDGNKETPVTSGRLNLLHSGTSSGLLPLTSPRASAEQTPSRDESTLPTPDSVRTSTSDATGRSLSISGPPETVPYLTSYLIKSPFLLPSYLSSVSHSGFQHLGLCRSVAMTAATLKTSFRWCFCWN